MLCSELCSGVNAAAGRRRRGAELFHRAVEQAHVAVEQVVLPRRQTPCLVHLVAQPHHSVGELGHLAQPQGEIIIIINSVLWYRLIKLQQFLKRVEMKMLVARQLLWYLLQEAVPLLSCIRRQN